MSTKAEICNLVKSAKIGKVLKENLIIFVKAKDEELQWLKADNIIFLKYHEK